MNIKTGKYIGKYKKPPPLVARAYGAVAYAIRTGNLITPSICSCCPATNKRLHAHHEDYNKPLEVVWVCPPCHGEWRMTGTRPAHDKPNIKTKKATRPFAAMEDRYQIWIGGDNYKLEILKPSRFESIGFPISSEVDGRTLNDNIVRKERDRIIRFAIKKRLSPREELVMRAFFGIDHKEYSLTKIGEAFGVSRQRVCEIKEKAIRKLKYVLRPVN